MVEKSKILSEISRLADLNGGVPLGRLKFASETGIGEAGWRKYWVRWNDAVKEAGFSPNLKTSSYSEEYLLERYVDLIEELGHFPVSAELRMKARLSDFPSEKTLSKLGSKSVIASKIIAFAESRDVPPHVIEICRDISQEESVLTDASSENPKPDGYVYLLKMDKHFKIGRSNNFDRRKQQIDTKLPAKTDMVHVIKTDDPEGIEYYWHRRFSEKRRNGEWFELNVNDVRAFKRRKFM